MCHTHVCCVERVNEINRAEKVARDVSLIQETTSIAGNKDCNRPESGYCVLVVISSD